MKKQRCYIYTRVSTAMQVDGFSLDAQKEKLKKYADYQDMVVESFLMKVNPVKMLMAVHSLRKCLN